MQLFHKWEGLRLELAQYTAEHNIYENTFRFLGIYEWQNVYSKVLEAFVDEQYSRTNGIHWSNINNGFRKDIDVIYYFQIHPENNITYEWIKKLPEIINDTYSVKDYYITDKKFNWLITENHHDIIKFLGKGLDKNKIKTVVLPEEKTQNLSAYGDNDTNAI